MTTRSLVKAISFNNIFFILIGIAAIAYLVSKAIDGGNDINVYLNAAEQLLRERDIYKPNQYNYYLYSPLFAILLVPFTFIDWSIARVLWVIINLAFAFRIWQLLQQISCKKISLSAPYKRVWTITVAALSFGFLNHNLNLGQVTVLIMWLTMEGLYQINKKEELRGAALMALGINIKIIPLIALGYLFLKGKFNAIAYTLAFVGASLLLPALILGWGYNNELLSKWKEAINPTKEKFAFENNDGCNSLNALLPAFLYDKFEEPTNIEAEPGWHFKRKIADLPVPTLTIILQISRILVLLFVPFSIFFHYKNRQHEHLYYHWEIAYLLLATLLIFPHQMKYSMLYFVPTGAYILFYYLYALQEKFTLHRFQIIIGGFAGLLLLILAVMGRDIIGNYLVNILDFYHFMGFSNLLFLLILAVCSPYRLIQLYEQKKHTEVV